MPGVCVMHCRRRFFFWKNDVPGIFMPGVCVMHCRRRLFFGKSDVRGFVMPCVCVMHCRRRFFVRKKWRSWDLDNKIIVKHNNISAFVLFALVCCTCSRTWYRLSVPPTAKQRFSQRTSPAPPPEPQLRPQAIQPRSQFQDSHLQIETKESWSKPTATCARWRSKSKFPKL